jgi:hypothetical protein
MEKEVVMFYEKLKKSIISIMITGLLIIPVMVVSSSTVLAQGPRRGYDRRENNWNRQEWRRRERRALKQLRRLDRDRRLRYRYWGNTRIIGYHDRFGRFHRYGYYDRFGRFCRYR